MKVIKLIEDDYGIIRYGYIDPRHSSGTLIFCRGSMISGFVHHRTEGPAVILPTVFRRDPIYCLHGFQYPSFDSWFKDLTQEEKIQALYNPEIFGVKS